MTEEYLKNISEEDLLFIVNLLSLKRNIEKNSSQRITLLETSKVYEAIQQSNEKPLQKVSGIIILSDK